MSRYAPLLRAFFLVTAAFFINLTPLQAQQPAPSASPPGEVNFGNIPYLPATTSSSTYNYYGMPSASGAYSDGSYYNEPYSLDYDNFYSAPYFDNYGGFYTSPYWGGWGDGWHNNGWHHHGWWHHHGHHDGHHGHAGHHGMHGHSGGHHMHTGGGHHGGGHHGGGGHHK